MPLTLTRAFPPIVQHPRCYLSLTEDEARQMPLKPLEHGKSLVPGHAGTIVLYTDGEVHGYVVDVKYTDGPPDVFLLPCSIAPTADEVDRFDGLLIEDVEAYSLLQRLHRPSHRLDIFHDRDSVETQMYLHAHRYTLDPTAGKIVNTSPLTPAEVKALYDEAAKIVSGLMPLPGAVPKRIGVRETEMLRHALALFAKVLAASPRNCRAMWLSGKACCLLGQPDRALQQFIHAAECDPAQNQYAIDASHLAIERGEGAIAVRMAEQAMHVAPDDPELVANLAVALLIAGQAERAATLSDQALQMRPGQKRFGVVKAVCAAVVSQGHARPRNEAEVADIARVINV